ncbi:family 16 glycoside hydrolase, partial [uncultured Gimesia sp.]|uniref:family 16 glycoside hydrolase n=1 Tax=uncultured Gimesia sp. TaxID=1678688 RepID=UPI003452BBEA
MNAQAADLPQYKPLFNGKDLTGWVNVNTDKDTWYAKDGMLICTGHPIGVMRTDKQYENFLLHI